MSIKEFCNQKFLYNINNYYKINDKKDLTDKLEKLNITEIYTYKKKKNNTSEILNNLYDYSKLNSLFYYKLKQTYQEKKKKNGDNILSIDYANNFNKFLDNKNTTIHYSKTYQDLKDSIYYFKYFLCDLNKDIQQYQHPNLINVNENFNIFDKNEYRIEYHQSEEKAIFSKDFRSDQKKETQNIIYYKNHGGINYLYFPKITTGQDNLNRILYNIISRKKGDINVCVLKEEKTTKQNIDINFDHYYKYSNPNFYIPGFDQPYGVIPIFTIYLLTKDQINDSIYSSGKNFLDTNKILIDEILIYLKPNSRIDQIDLTNDVVGYRFRISNSPNLRSYGASILNTHSNNTSMYFVFAKDIYNDTIKYNYIINKPLITHKIDNTDINIVLFWLNESKNMSSRSKNGEDQIYHEYEQLLKLNSIFSNYSYLKPLDLNNIVKILNMILYNNILYDDSKKKKNIILEILYKIKNKIEDIINLDILKKNYIHSSESLLFTFMIILNLIKIQDSIDKPDNPITINSDIFNSDKISNDIPKKYNRYNISQHKEKIMHDYNNSYVITKLKILVSDKEINLKDNCNLIIQLWFEVLENIYSDIFITVNPEKLSINPQTDFNDIIKYEKNILINIIIKNEKISIKSVYNQKLFQFNYKNKIIQSELLLACIFIKFIQPENKLLLQLSLTNEYYYFIECAPHDKIYGINQDIGLFLNKNKKLSSEEKKQIWNKDNLDNYIKKNGEVINNKVFNDSYNILGNVISQLFKIFQTKNIAKILFNKPKITDINPLYYKGWNQTIGTCAFDAVLTSFLYNNTTGSIVKSTLLNNLSELNENDLDIFKSSSFLGRVNLIHYFNKNKKGLTLAAEIDGNYNMNLIQLLEDLLFKNIPKDFKISDYSFKLEDKLGNYSKYDSLLSLDIYNKEKSLYLSKNDSNSYLFNFENNKDMRFPCIKLSINNLYEKTWVENNKILILPIDLLDIKINNSNLIIIYLNNINFSKQTQYNYLSKLQEKDFNENLTKFNNKQADIYGQFIDLKYELKFTKFNDDNISDGEISFDVNINTNSSNCNISINYDIILKELRDKNIDFDNLLTIKIIDSKKMIKVYKIINIISSQSNNLKLFLAPDDYNTKYSKQFKLNDNDNIGIEFTIRNYVCQLPNKKINNYMRYNIKIPYEYTTDNKKYKLTSIICSNRLYTDSSDVSIGGHAISYIRCNNDKWYVYDNERTYKNKTLKYIPTTIYTEYDQNYIVFNKPYSFNLDGRLPFIINPNTYHHEFIYIYMCHCY